MIRGTVVGLQAHVGVTLRLPHHGDRVIDFVIDTGFDGALALPESAVVALGLPFVIDIDATLADDSQIVVDVYRATIIWDGRECDVALLATGDRPLLGTALLDGFNLNVDFADNGAVTLTRLGLQASP